jgi:hypothetical protein
MSRATLALATALVILGPQIAMSQSSQFHMLDPTLPYSVNAIRVASDVFREHNPDLNEYNVQVVRDRDVVVVVFVGKQRPQGTRGVGAVPGFEVELDPSDLHVIRSHFVR